jgi:hypothetical protein
MCLVLGPAHEPTRIAAVRVNALDKRKAGSGALQNPFGSVPILNVGPMDLDREKPPIRVGQDVALAPFDLLARVVALRSPF